jgi:hypothetical protein
MKKKDWFDFLGDLDDIVYYLYLNQKYIDFQTIMYLIEKDKTFTWRILLKLKVPFIEYNNKNLYKFDDIISNVEIMELIDISKLGFD